MWIKVDGFPVHLNFGHGKAAQKKEEAFRNDPKALEEFAAATRKMRLEIAARRAAKVADSTRSTKEQSMANKFQVVATIQNFDTKELAEAFAKGATLKLGIDVKPSFLIQEQPEDPTETEDISDPRPTK